MNGVYLSFCKFDKPVSKKYYMHNSYTCTIHLLYFFLIYMYLSLFYKVYITKYM